MLVSRACCGPLAPGSAVACSRELASLPEHQLALSPGPWRSPGVVLVWLVARLTAERSLTALRRWSARCRGSRIDAWPSGALSAEIRPSWSLERSGAASARHASCIDMASCVRSLSLLCRCSPLPWRGACARARIGRAAGREADRTPSSTSRRADREGAAGRAAAEGAQGLAVRGVLRRFLQQAQGGAAAATARCPRSAPASSSTARKASIVTNNHVIDGADEIIVNFHDGTKLKVDKVIGKDTKTDLALLKVTPKKPLADVKFGSSADASKVGDWVMAIGNPFGLGGSVTVGIISAKQPRHQFRPLRRLPADRRRHQQGQLGRSAVQHGRRSHRREHGDHLADGRLDRHRLRRALRYGRGRRRPAASSSARRAAAGSASRSRR